jgi:hypothetical protein
MRRIGKAIDIHPGGSGRNTGIARVQVLMEMRYPETDHGHVNSLDAFGAKSYRDLP